MVSQIRIIARITNALAKDGIKDLTMPQLTAIIKAADMVVAAFAVTPEPIKEDPAPALKVADTPKLMTLEEFRATGFWVENLDQHASIDSGIDMGTLDGYPGRIYAQRYWIEDRIRDHDTRWWYAWLRGGLAFREELSVMEEALYNLYVSGIHPQTDSN